MTTDYIIYADRNEDFECSIQLEGADLNKASARLVVETNNNVNLYFNGNISADGHCVVPIKNVKAFLKENTTGKLALEVIVEDTYFKPWQSSFIVAHAKKATVVVKEQTSRQQVACDVSIKEQVMPQSTKNIKSNNVTKNKNIDSKHVASLVDEANEAKEIRDLIKRLMKK